MLKMELDNLKFRFFRFDESKVATDVKKKLNDLFEKPDKTWDDAYQIENQIAMLLTGDCLRREIKVRLREALKRNATDAAVLQTDYDGLLKSNKKEGRTSSDDFLRYFLLEVLENVHWASKLKHLARKYRREATGNTLLLAALALFFGPVAAHPAAVLVAEQLVPGADFRSIGSLFSRLITLQRPRSELKLEELHNAQKFPYIFLRACIGACGALIVYFFFQSELVKTDVFPKFMNGVVSSDGKSPARLIVWSFIAGFSEWLVPSVLSSTERQFGGAMGGRPPRNRESCDPPPVMWRDCVAYGLSQACQKRGLRGSALSDNGSAVTAAEIVEGLNRLSDPHQITLPYSPYMNAKIVTLWELVEGRPSACSEGYHNFLRKQYDEHGRVIRERTSRRSKSESNAAVRCTPDRRRLAASPKLVESGQQETFRSVHSH